MTRKIDRLKAAIPQGAFRLAADRSRDGEDGDVDGVRPTMKDQAMTQMQEMIGATKRAVAESKALLESVRPLRTRIAERLTNHSFCAVFDNHLREFFPETPVAVVEREKR